MDERADIELVKLARAGDKEAFGCLIERYQQVVRRAAKSIVANEHIAQELVQEAMLQAYLSLDRLRDNERFQSWLYGIVLNVCRSFIRDQKTAFFSLEAMMGGMRFDAVPFTSIEPDPEEVAEAQELHRAVLKAVAGLPPKNRAATLLFYYEQLSLREIAATLGLSMAAVKGRLHKARSQLREQLLPVMSESSLAKPEKQRRRKMVKVTIIDVIAKEHKDEETGKSWSLCTIVLMDEERRRILPIWVGEREATIIATGLRGFQLPRPMTHTFMANVLKAVGVELEEVRVEELKDDTYYAVAKLRSGDTVREVDARPSDAFALAVLTGCPIYAAEEVMEKAGRDIPEDVRETQPRGKGIDSMVEVVSKTWAKHGHEAREQEIRDIMAYVFDSEGEAKDN